MYLMQCYMVLPCGMQPLVWGSFILSALCEGTAMTQALQKQSIKIFDSTHRWLKVSTSVPKCCICLIGCTCGVEYKKFLGKS